LTSESLDSAEFFAERKIFPEVSKPAGVAEHASTEEEDQSTTFQLPFLQLIIRGWRSSRANTYRLLFLRIPVSSISNGVVGDIAKSSLGHISTTSLALAKCPFSR